METLEEKIKRFEGLLRYYENEVVIVRARICEMVDQIHQCDKED